MPHRAVGIECSGMLRSWRIEEERSEPAERPKGFVTRAHVLDMNLRCVAAIVKRTATDTVQCYEALCMSFACAMYCVEELIRNLALSVQFALNNRYQDLSRISWSDTGYEELDDGTSCAYIEVRRVHALFQ
jgi:hypothetical protein